MPTYLDATWVVKWSHIVFDRPVPLIPRRDVQVGDVVMSSHGIALRVSDVRVNRHPVTQHPTTVWIKGGHRGGRPFHSEQHDGSIPLLERDGVIFGAFTYDKDRWGQVPEVSQPIRSHA